MDIRTFVPEFDIREVEKAGWLEKKCINFRHRKMTGDLQNYFCDINKIVSEQMEEKDGNSNKK